MSDVAVGPLRLRAGVVSHKRQGSAPVAACSARIEEGTRRSQSRYVGRTGGWKTWSTHVLVVSTTDGQVFTHEFKGEDRADALHFLESVNAQARLAREAAAQAAAPGWYPAEGVLRWWDGRQWTAHTAPLAGPQDRR